MRKFFDPAVNLMNKLRYSHKFALISIIFLALVTGILFLVLRINRDIDFTRKEIKGSEYITSLISLLTLFQEHRSYSYSYLLGHEYFLNRLKQVNAEINVNMEKLDSLDAKYGRELKTSSRWSGIKRNWNELNKNNLNLNPEENFHRHTGLNQNILDLISATGRESNLILDYEAKSYYLIITTISQIPSLTEYVSQARGRSTGIAAKKMISPQENDNLRTLIVLVNINLENANKNFSYIFGADKNMKNQLEPLLSQLNQSVGNFIQLIYNNIINKKIIKITPERVFNEGTIAISSSIALYNTEQNVLDKMLDDRINRLLWQRFFALFLTSIFILGSSYLYIGFYLSVIYAIKNLERVAREVSEGNFDSKAEISSKDEIGSLSNSINIMTYNLKDYLETEKFLRGIILASIESPDIEQSLKTIVAETGNYFKADRCFFMEYEKCKKEMLALDEYESWRSSHNVRDMVHHEFSKEQTAPFVQIAIEERQPFFVNDLEASNISEATKTILKDFHVKSFVAIPVYYGDNPLGCLVTQFTKTHRDFSKRDIEILSAIANQSAIVINKARIMKEINDARNREEIIKKINNEILTSESLDMALLNFAKEVCIMAKADRAAFWLYDAKAKKFTPAQEYRCNEDVPSVKGKVIISEEFNDFLEQNFCKNKQPLIINNSTDPAYSEELRRIFSELGMKSALGVPMFYQNNFVGVISVANTYKFRNYTNNDVKEILPISQQIAIGINLFQLNEKLSKSLVTERLIREIITSGRKSENHDTIFDFLLENLIKIFPADRALHFHFSEAGEVYIKNEKFKEGFSPISSEKIFTGNNIQDFLKGTVNNIIIIDDVSREITDSGLRKRLEALGINSFVFYVADGMCVKLPEHRIVPVLIAFSEPELLKSDDIDNFRFITDTAALTYNEIKQKKETEELKENFLATLTHDMKSPILAVQKTLEYLSSGLYSVKPEQYKELLNEIYATNT